MYSGWRMSRAGAIGAGGVRRAILTRAHKREPAARGDEAREKWVRGRHDRHIASRFTDETRIARW